MGLIGTEFQVEKFLAMKFTTQHDLFEQQSSNRALNFIARKFRLNLFSYNIGIQGEGLEFSSLGEARAEQEGVPFAPLPPPTRWSTTLSSKVNLPHAIVFGALCGANLVTHPSKFGGKESFDLHLVVSVTNANFLRFSGHLTGQMQCNFIRM